MKILLISNLFPPHEIGGYEIRARDCAVRLARRGHTLRILTSNHLIEGRPTPPEPHVSRTLRIHGFYGHPWLPIRELRSLEEHNHRILIKEIESFEPDVIHVWNMGGISKSLLHRLEALPIPTVYDVSDHWIARSLAADVWLSWWNEKHRPAATIIRSILSALGLRKKIDTLTPTHSAHTLKFRNIYFCSAFMRDHTAAKGWPVAHATIIHCGVNTSHFAVRMDHSRFEKLLWVGRLSPDKDPITAIRALAAARNAGLTRLTLDLFGHGDAPFLAELDAEIVRLGLEGIVTRQLAKGSDMPQLYARYDALIFTSNWGEPFALTPLEAMAAAVPVITSLDGGQRELARHGENCLVAAAADSALYATRIAELASSEELRTSIAAEGLRQVRELHDMDYITSQIEQFLLKASLP